jgi:hypothetical protein
LPDRNSGGVVFAGPVDGDKFHVKVNCLESKNHDTSASADSLLTLSRWQKFVRVPTDSIKGLKFTSIDFWSFGNLSWLAKAIN